MLSHFEKHHSISDMVIKPIEFCDKKMLRIRVRFWQLELNTAFPYGLNDWVDGAKISNSCAHATNDKSAIPIYNNFNYVKSNRNKRGSGINNRTNNNNNTNNTNNTNHDLHNTLEFDPNKFITNIIESTKDNICNKTCKSKMNLEIGNIRQLLIFTAKELHISEISYPYNEYLLYATKDICLYKLVGSHNFKIKVKSNRFIIQDYQDVPYRQN